MQRRYTNTGLGLNTNLTGVGAMLNSVARTASAELEAVLNTIDYLPDSGAVQDAYQQISPEKAGALTQLGLAGALFQMRNLAVRTTNLRFLPDSENGGGRGGLGSLNFTGSRDQGLLLAYNGAIASDLFNLHRETDRSERGWSLFVDGGATFGRQNSTLNQTGYNFTTGGFTLGADYRIQDRLIVGLATGYNHTGADFAGTVGGGVSASQIPVNAYLAYFPAPFYLYGSLGYALNLYNLQRGINFGGLGTTASSAPTGNQLNLYTETGYDLKLRRLIITPAATLVYSQLWIGGFSESGAGALNLAVGSQNAASVQSGIGGRLTIPGRIGSVRLAPQASAFYQHEFANGSQGLDAGLGQGSAPFTFQTQALGRNFALVQGSLTAGLSQNLLAQVTYTAEVGRAGYQAQNINAGLRYEF